MTDGVILAAAGVRALDPDYEPTTLAGRWATCYDARHHRYVVRYVQPLGLRPVKARTGDEALDFDLPPVEMDEGAPPPEAFAAMRAIVEAKRRQVLEVMRAADKPMTYNEVAQASGFGKRWVRAHLPVMAEVETMGRTAYGKVWGLVGVEYNLPEWVQDGAQA